MKTKEELIKIYSAYLPYGLSVFFEENNAFYPLVINNSSVSMKGGFNINEVINEEMKPLLWSMDMLTKEIEHKGERFTPMSRFFATFGYLPNTSHHEHLQVQVYNKLLEWHFNVFGLHESEFIKKENL